MKIGLISDSHYGVRSDNVFFHDYFKKSVSQFFIPELRKRGIKQIIHLGDLVDRRKYINYLTAKRLREDFLEPINAEFKMDIIAGNHDTFFKNTNSLNALTELVQGAYQNIRIYTEPTEVLHDDMPILYVPWICSGNEEDTLEMIKETKAEICFGHLELQGFEIQKGHISTHGLDKSYFSKFDVVCSGHYHHKSDYGSIHYLGAFCEHTWTDYGDPRGFHVYDTETRSIEFIQNPHTVFKKVRYDDEGKQIQTLLEMLDNDPVTGKIVKIIVRNKTNNYWFDLFVEKLESQNPLEMQTVEDHLNLYVENQESIVENASDTLDMFKTYVKNLEFDPEKKNNVEKTIMSLYKEAMNIS